MVSSLCHAIWGTLITVVDAEDAHQIILNISKDHLNKEEQTYYHNLTNNAP